MSLNHGVLLRWRCILGQPLEHFLRGQFLLRLKSAYDAAADVGERERIMQAARWGLAALCNREEVVCHDNK